MSDSTLVITSCNRHDLLRETLESLADNRGISGFAETIIVEDSPAGEPDWLRTHKHWTGEITWLSNGCRRGQVFSIDRAYPKVRTPYIFHCEDDWKFTRGDFMRESKEILDRHTDILQVILGQYNDHPIEPHPTHPNLSVKTLNWREGWSGFSWNPGLRRTSDYHRIGSFGRVSGYSNSTGLGCELAVGKHYAALGYRVSVLPQVHISHLGNSRSTYRTNQPEQKQPPRALIVIPACHTYDYDAWQADIHVNGARVERYQALRDTWLKDVQTHSPYLDYKFFFGKGAATFPRPDEVFLDVADDYKALPLKVNAAFKWAQENGYEKVVKCDDDSYLYVDRMAHDMFSPEWENVPYYGFKHDHGYVTGGASYVLNKRALYEIASTHPNHYQHWAEDVECNRLLDKAGITGTYNNGHQPGFAEHWYDIGRIDSEGRAVSRRAWDVDKVFLRAIHAVKPDDMRSLYGRLVPVNA